ncbi:MAG: ATP-binding cassette domain-containing protein [Magnetococcales bacterium]|nr:ATP-binding cassette domain-containing protein [Magnetococcales bacterium]
MLNSLKIENVQAVAGPVFSLTIAAGELLCLTGSSGSGKSLLLRAIADLDPCAGTIWFNDRKQSDTPAPLWRREVALLQAVSYWWHDRVGDHFDKPQEATPVMEALGLTREVMDWHIERMSTGERQRMSIVRLLFNRPLVLLLDEPTANLDPTTSRQVESLILDYKQRHRVPVLWVSHDLDQVKRVADRHFDIRSNQLLEVN